MLETEQQRVIDSPVPTRSCTTPSPTSDTMQVTDTAAAAAAAAPQHPVSGSSTAQKHAQDEASFVPNEEIGNGEGEENDRLDREMIVD